MRRNNIKIEKLKPKKLFWMEEGVPCSDPIDREIFYKMSNILSERNKRIKRIKKEKENETGFEPLF